MGSGKYDKILKENLSAFLNLLIEKTVGIPVSKLEVISPDLQVTIEREPDFLAVYEPVPGDKTILHIEFQTKNETDMVIGWLSIRR